MKTRSKKILMLLLLTACASFAKSQTAYRNNAGLRGDAGAVSGFYETSEPVNFPTAATSWWHLLDVRHSNNTNNYAMQFSGSFFDQELYFRKTNDNATQAWSKVILETDGKVGIGTSSPVSQLSILGTGTGMSYDGIGSGYFGGLGLNRETKTGAIFNPSGKAYQIVNGGADQNLHFQVYNGDGSSVSGHALVISGSNANIGIGTATPTEKLSVNGKIRAKEIKVETANWPDYVFEDDYPILSLAETEKYIQTNKHLPEMPTSKEAEANGIALGELNKLLLKKIEELTLHLIKLSKENEQMKNNFKQLEQKVNKN